MGTTALYAFRSALHRDGGDQVSALEAYGAGPGKPAELYVDGSADHTSDPRRPAYCCLLEDLRADRLSGLAVWRLDRLGLGLGGLAELFGELGLRRVRFSSIEDRLDYEPEQLGVLAELLNRAAVALRRLAGHRVAAGQAAAMAAGKKWWPRRTGARQYLTDGEVQSILAFWDAGLPVAAIAAKTGVTRPTVYRVTRQSGRKRRR